MKVIHMGRGGGKTTAAIKWFWAVSKAGGHPILLTINERERGRLISTYKLPKEQVHTWESAVRENVLRGTGESEIFVEEAGTILELILRERIAGISIT